MRYPFLPLLLLRVVLFVLMGGYSVRTNEAIHLDHGGQIALGRSFAVEMLRLEALGAIRDKNQALRQPALNLQKQGRGVAKDLGEAHFWLSLAAINGGEHSEEVIEQFAGQMTSQEIDGARRKAKEWAKKSLSITRIP